MPNTLEKIIIQMIRENGPMDFATFMDLALCHPQYGYYITRDPLGVAGDFTTAPEISQMFGEILGAWVVDVWHKMGSPAPFYLLEVGPGRGTLMADMLRVASQVAGFKAAVRILMLEASPVLREKQREKLAGFSAHWLDHVLDAPRDAPIIIVGNEFLDTVPIHQVMLQLEGWVERRVVVDPITGGLGFAFEPMNTDLISYLPRYPKPDEIYEISPVQVAHTRDWGSLIKEHGGAVLQVDYGHAMTASGELLHAIRGHQHVSILDDVGSADITCNVDYEPLMRVAEGMGLTCLPVVRQGDFLRALGIEQRAEKLRSKDESVDAALSRLVDADKMGNLFKVGCFYYGLIAPPEGF